MYSPTRLKRNTDQIKDRFNDIRVKRSRKDTRSVFNYRESLEANLSFGEALCQVTTILENNFMPKNPCDEVPNVYLTRVYRSHVIPSETVFLLSCMGFPPIVTTNILMLASRCRLTVHYVVLTKTRTPR